MQQSTTMVLHRSIMAMSSIPLAISKQMVVSSHHLQGHLKLSTVNAVSSALTSWPRLQRMMEDGSTGELSAMGVPFACSQIPANVLVTAFSHYMIGLFSEAYKLLKNVELV